MQRDREVGQSDGNMKFRTDAGHYGWDIFDNGDPTYACSTGGTNNPRPSGGYAASSYMSAISSSTSSPVYMPINVQFLVPGMYRVCLENTYNLGLQVYFGTTMGVSGELARASDNATGSNRSGTTAIRSDLLVNVFPSSFPYLNNTSMRWRFQVSENIQNGASANAPSRMLSQIPTGIISPDPPNNTFTINVPNPTPRTMDEQGYVVDDWIEIASTWSADPINGWWRITAVGVNQITIYTGQHAPSFPTIPANYTIYTGHVRCKFYYLGGSS
jgi:hypothetical protein